MRLQTSVLRSGDLLRPDVLIIEQDMVMLQKRSRNLITIDKTVIPLKEIAGIRIHSHLIGTEIDIYSSSAKMLLRLKGFSRSDAIKLMQYFKTIKKYVYENRRE